LNNLALLLDRTGRKREALPLLVRAAEAGDAEAAFNAGVLCEELGDSAGASGWLRRAAKLGDRDAARVLRSRSG
jgi:TPR repeat protein